MESQEEQTIGSARESLQVLSETSKHIDSFKHMSTPGNSKLTIYSELIELKNTLDALKAALVKFISPLRRNIPQYVIQSIASVLTEVLHTLLSVDHTTTADTWNAALLKVYQLDFVLAFQCHQLQEICLEHYHNPTSLLCTSSSKEFWDTYFAQQWFVPWGHFWERILQRGWAEPGEEKVVRHFLDFCADGYVSPYELCLFLKWFGQLELAFKNLIMTLKSGLLVGAIPATEANTLLKGKMSGSFLVRFSKTRPGCFAVTVGGDNSAPRHFLLNYLEPGKFSMQHSDTVYTSIHNFVQMQPRLKYPVTTRVVNDLMADVPTLRASVEIHTPGMRPFHDMRSSGGSVSSLQDFFPLSTSPSAPFQQGSSKHGEVRAVYDTESQAPSQAFATNGPGNSMRSSSGGFGFVSGFGSINPNSRPSTSQATSSVPMNANSHSATNGNTQQSSMPMGFGPPSTSPGTSNNQFSSPNATSSVPMGFGATPMGFGAPSSSFGAPSGFGPSRSSNAPAGFAPVQKTPMGFGSVQSTGFAAPSSASAGANAQFSLTNTMIPHAMVPGSQSQSQSVQQTNQSPLSLSISPSERNAMFFPFAGDSSNPTPISSTGYQLAMQHQQSQLKRSTSQQQPRTLDPKSAVKPGIRRSTSSQLRRRPDGTMPEQANGPDLFDDDLRAAAPLDICVICLDRERATLFLECSHMVCCTECSGLVSTCPICRQTITRVIPVYRS